MGKNKEKTINDSFIGKIINLERLLVAGNSVITVSTGNIVLETKIKDFENRMDIESSRKIQVCVDKTMSIDSLDSLIRESLIYNIETDSEYRIINVGGYCLEEYTCINRRESYRTKKPTDQNLHESVEKLLTAATE